MIPNKKRVNSPLGGSTNHSSSTRTLYVDAQDPGNGHGGSVAASCAYSADHQRRICSVDTDDGWCRGELLDVALIITGRLPCMMAAARPMADYGHWWWPPAGSFVGH